MDSIRLSLALAMIALWFGPAITQDPRLPERRYRHTANILGMFPDPNGKWLITFGVDDEENFVRKWNLETMKPMPVAAGLRKCQSMALSPDGSKVAYLLLEEDPTTKQFRHKVLVADADGENPVLALSIPDSLGSSYGVGLLSWNDERFVCIGTNRMRTDRKPDIFIIDWKTAKVTEYQRGPAHDRFLAMMSPSQDGKLPFHSHYYKSIILWDLKTGKKWRELKPRDSENVRLAVYHESSKKWAVISGGGVCTFFDQRGKKMFQKDDGLDTTCIVPGGRDLWYFANYSGSVYSMDYSRLPPQKATVYTPPDGPRLTTTHLIVLIPKINWLAVASSDVPQNPDEEPSGRITLVDLKSRQIRAVIENDTITVLDPPRPAVHRGD